MDNASLIGCWRVFHIPNGPPTEFRSYLPLSSLRSHTVIKDVASRTRLVQSFINETDENQGDIFYSFPLYAGVSVVSFAATVGEVRIQGVVKEKRQAGREFKEAVAKGEAAGLLEQLPEAADIFTTHIGNVPAGGRVVVEIEYIGELKYDAQADAIRLTIPSSIAPRYGAQALSGDSTRSSKALSPTVQDAIQFVVDVESPEGCPVRQIQSPSHPIAVTMGATSGMAVEITESKEYKEAKEGERPATKFMPNRASAALSIHCTELEMDFIIVVNVENANIPKALLETHPTIPDQRALMVTLVPRFKLPISPSEVVFVVDRSGSMQGKMITVIQAMTTMLKSLRVGIQFNICSFGSNHAFLWPDGSRGYDEAALTEALDHIDTFDANFGGTEMIRPLQAALDQRCSKSMPLNVILLTDGEIWGQDALFELVRGAADEHHSRFFALGIGHDVSTALVEGVAAEGNGVSQFVADGEQMDKKMVRLLKAALMPHLKEYSLDVKYHKKKQEQEVVDDENSNNKNNSGSNGGNDDKDDDTIHNSNDDDDWDIIKSEDACRVSIGSSAREKEKSSATMPVSEEGKNTTLPVREKENKSVLQAAMSFFSNNVSDSDDDAEREKERKKGEARDRFADLPEISAPAVLQAPARVPPLYPFSRTTVYLLLDATTPTPSSIVLRAVSDATGPIELEIPVEAVGVGETIHQLAARRAVIDLERDGSGGWLGRAIAGEQPLRTRYAKGLWHLLVEREAVRLGIAYQVVGKWCSFVAREGGADTESFLREAARKKKSVGTGQMRSFNLSYTGNRAPGSGINSLRSAPSPQYSLGNNCNMIPSSSTAIPPPPMRLSRLQAAPPDVRSSVPQLASYSKPASFGRATKNAPSPVASHMGVSDAEAECECEDEDENMEMSFMLDDDSPPDERFHIKNSGGSNNNGSGEEKMRALIRLQKFDGSWEWGPTLLQIVGVDPASVKAMDASAPHDTTVAATALAVAFFRTHLADDADAWELLVDKALQWLAGQPGVDGEVEVGKAGQLLSATERVN